MEDQGPERTVSTLAHLPLHQHVPIPVAAHCSLPFFTPYRTVHLVRWTSNPAAERDALAMAIGHPLACEQPPQAVPKCNEARVRSLLRTLQTERNMAVGGHDGLHMRRRERALELLYRQRAAS